mgnify:CR=1 FL=1
MTQGNINLAKTVGIGIQSILCRFNQGRIWLIEYVMWKVYIIEACIVSI